MFYSQTFLARKGPLGTVWCAAHLQHRLKKSHYTSTNIPSAVDRIIFPEVPIALRMSGHLLLGVVRIYSKKVDYLYHDCNVILIGLRRAFTAAEVSLPENATKAKYESVTLPPTFELDSLVMDLDLPFEGSPDRHLRPLEEITLADQIPTDQDQYVAIPFDETIEVSEQIAERAPPSPRAPVAKAPTHVEPPPSAPSEETPPTIEVLRHAVPPTHAELPTPSRLLVEEAEGVGVELPSDQFVIEKEPFTPIDEDALRSIELSRKLQQHEEPSAPPSEPTTRDTFDSHVSFGLVSPEPAVLLPSPPVPRPRPRKRKQYFDEATVLTNKFIKKSLDDCSDILRKRKIISATSLGLWRLNNRQRKDEIFHEFDLSGTSNDIKEVMKHGASGKPHLLLEEEVTPQPTTEVAPPPPPEPVARPMEVELAVSPEQEIERLRRAEGPEREAMPPGLFPSPPRVAPPSPPPKDAYTPISPRSIEFETMPPVPTPSITTPSVPRYEMETPIIRDEQFEIAAPEVSETRDNELFFLEAESTAPGLDAAPTVESLSVRTRAAAQYLKRRSSIMEDVTAGISLDKLLEGKSTKICARMFFEVLVLKSYGLIDVQQEQPYGDVALTLTSMLMKAQI